MRLAQNVLLALVSLLLFFGVAEGLARLRYNPERIRYEGIFEYDRDKIYALKRNLTDGHFVGQPVRTNSFGHRDREIPLRKPANGFRVIAVGDSVTFGHGVRAEEAWPEQLERRLSNRFPSLQVEVVNTAVPGNSPFQEYHDLDRALVLEPDAAVIQFVLNDVVEPYRVFRRYGGTGKDYHGVEDLPYVDWLLSQHSALYLFLRDVGARVRFRALTREDVRAGALRQEATLSWSAAADESDHPAVRQAWRECLAWMQREVDLCERHGVAVVLLATPVNLQFRDETRTYAQRRLAEFAATNDIAWVDLLETLRDGVTAEIVHRDPAAATLTTAELAARHPQTWEAFWQRYFLDHDHLTPAGHALVARTLVSRLEPIAQ